MHWFSRKRRREQPVVGLVLPGGGARNAYQAGVLRAVAEIAPPERGNPFPVVTGTSSGAINAALLACSALQFREGVQHICGTWEHFRIEKVFRADTATALRNTWRWLSAMLSGRMGRSGPLSILDNTPLRRMMESHLRFARIQQCLDAGCLRALAVTASGYTSGCSVTFYQGVPGLVPWRRARRCGVSAEIGIDHLMASSAIPMVFPAVRVGGEYFGDGAMRETAPLSPALHLGANRLLIVGVRTHQEARDCQPSEPPLYPTPGQIAGYVFDTLFLDSLDADLERLNRINHTLSETGESRVEYRDTALRPIEFLMLSPSRDVLEFVPRHLQRIPRPLRALLRAIGALTRGSLPLLSYLLFEGPYCRELLELGYADAMARRDEIERLLFAP